MATLDHLRREQALELLRQVREMIATEDRPFAAYATVRNELRDAAESLARAASVYAEVIKEREAGEEPKGRLLP